MGMIVFRVMGFYFLAMILACQSQVDRDNAVSEDQLKGGKAYQKTEVDFQVGREALLLTRFGSLDELKALVDFQYSDGRPISIHGFARKQEVRLTYRSGDREVVSVLKSGIREEDFGLARNGSSWAKLFFVIRCPYAVWNRNNLISIESLGRRRPWIFGKGDVAFYDLAETMVSHITEENRKDMTAQDLSEKGYLNTFNHVTAQAIMTSVFSERLADFVADVHERHNLPELISGQFTPEQLADLENGPVDNYIDLINNEWGQELGKDLKNKYHIHPGTSWNPEIMADYLNDIQAYYSWCFQLAFTPFRSTDEIVIRFAEKINRVRS